MAANLLPLLDAFGGLETDGERTSRAAGRALVCTNMRVGRDGKTLRKMRGASKLSATKVAARQPVLAFTEFFDRVGRRHRIARVPIGYYELNESDGTWALIDNPNSATETETDGVPQWIQANGSLWIVDGYGAYTYDGSTWADWKELTGPEPGLVNGSTARPSAAATTNGTPALTANASYEVFFVFADEANPTKISAPSPIMRVRTTATGKTITISTGYAGIDVAGGIPRIDNNLLHVPTDVATLGANAQLWAYISAADTPGVWYRGKTQDLGDVETEQTIDIDTEATTNQFTGFFGPPSGATGLIQYFDMSLVYGAPGFPTRLWLSEPDDPGAFRASSFIDADADKPQDPIRAVATMGGGGNEVAIIVRANSVWRLTGDSKSTLRLEEMQIGPGCVGPNAITRGLDGALYWAGPTGPWRFDGQLAVNLGVGRIEGAWRTAMGAVALG